jgi:shikimate 5-dehydrogenase
MPILKKTMSRLPSGSIVINATGMGKDKSDSPLGDRGLFPLDGIAWEINYREELDFWYQAMAQKESTKLLRGRWPALLPA